MRALSGNVLRDRDRQTLSAAFNLNTPLEVEEGGVKRTVRDRFEIGMAGVALAREGGFEKIAWDGASNEVPSRPIVQQITHEQLVDLVHAAHENGLETYVSAGMLAEHMKDAVFAGVDGVGIGTSMHHVDPATKLMGALKPDAIRAALRVRDEAEAHPQGRAARALARLDQMHFEGSLGDDEEETARKAPPRRPFEGRGARPRLRGRDRARRAPRRRRPPRQPDARARAPPPRPAPSASIAARPPRPPSSAKRSSGATPSPCASSSTTPTDRASAARVD